MGLAKWQNITQPSGSKFDFLLWEFLFGCLVDKMHAFKTVGIFFSVFFILAVQCRGIGSKPGWSEVIVE